MENPKISVIIPVYNVKAYLKQCITSVTGQSMREIEIICIDDGSTDGSVDILHELSAQDDRIRVIEQENKGAGAARNCGMRAAAGDFFIFLDSDDFFESDMLQKAYEKIEAYQADFVVFGSDQYYMDKDEYVRNPWVLQQKDIPPYMPFSHRELTDNVFKVFVGWAWDKLYRRSFVERYQLYFQEQRTTNDLLFVFSALVLAKRIAVVPEVLAHQRRGGTESLSVTREQSWFCFYDALTALRDRLVRENLYWELEQDYINYALHFSLWNLKTLASPTKELLKKKLCEEWFAALGISGKEKSYFYNQGEYQDYCDLIKGQKEWKQKR